MPELSVSHTLTSAYIGLGANLGDPQARLMWAMDQLAALPQCQPVARSDLYVSAPFEADGPDFINAVMHLQTTLSAHELLLNLQRIELLAGRERPYRNAPRTLDLDLLLFGTQHIHTATLQVPHPRLWERAFVLLPLAEIAPQWVSADQLSAVAGQRVMRLELR